MLLIDEIDRADEEFEAYLLEILSDFQVTVPEIGTIRAERPPRVILTSNRTREVHDALKRRCLYHWIDYPTRADGVSRSSWPACPRRPTGSPARSSPSSSRLRDGRPDQGARRRRDARLGGRAARARRARARRPTWSTRRSGVLLKYEEDVRAVRGANARRYLAEATASQG